MGTATPVIERSPGFYLINQLDGLDSQFLGSNEMRLRTPPNLPQASDPFVFNESDPRDFTVRIITPIYGGGVESRIPDREMPFRLTSINYQLRFWWRLHKIKELRERGIDGEQLSKKLFEEECQLWGALAGKRQYPSKVKMKIMNIQFVNSKNYQECYRYPPDTTKGNYKGFQYGIPSYALFPGQGKPPEKRHNPPEPNELPATVIYPKPVIRFQLRLACFDASKLSEIELALRFWASFGGIGGRTRRGLGSVEVSENGVLLEPVDQAEAHKFGCELRMKALCEKPITAWQQAITALQDFRQGVNQGRSAKTILIKLEDGSTKTITKPGRSFWPEANVIRQLAGHHLPRHRLPKIVPKTNFPRAAFGLPIVFHFKDGSKTDEMEWFNCDPKDCVLKPQGKERLASPLIIKAMVTESGQYAPIVLRLPTGHLDNLRLELRSDTPRKDYPLDTPSVSTLQGKDRTLSNFLDYFAPQES